jgi:hypothetical protein
MNEVPPNPDDLNDVDDDYRRASALDPSRPSESVRRAVLAHATRLAAERVSATGTTRATNQTRWWPAVFGTLAAAALAGLMVLPRLFGPSGVPATQAPAGVRALGAPAPAAAKANAPGSAAAPAPAPAGQNASAPVPAFAPAPAHARENASAPAAAAGSAPTRDSASGPPAAAASAPPPAPADAAAPQTSLAEVTVTGAPIERARAPTPATADASGPAGESAPPPAQAVAAAPAAAPPPAQAIAVAPAAAPVTPPAAAPPSASYLSEEVTVTGARRRAESPALATGAIALRRAAEIGDLRSLQALLDAHVAIDSRDDNGRTALMLATVNGHADVVDSLLEHGADPNVTDSQGMTPLEAARAGKESAIIAALQRKGAR